MSKNAEVEKMARLALSRQAETDMRVDAVDAKAGEAADAAASAGGRTPPPAAAPSLDGLYGWRPKAFSVWFTTGGGGEVGVCYPEKCVSYGGDFVGDDALNCGVHEDPDTKFRWCEPGKPSEKLPKLVLTLVKRAEDEGGVEGGSGVSAADLYLYLEWVESADDAKADHGGSDDETVAEYDAKLDRLSQVHVGVLALGGGAGGGGGGGEPYGDERSVCRAAAPSGSSTLNILQLCGFGKFTTKSSSAECGSFTASDEYDIGDVIDRDMRAKTGDDGLALVVRSGNTNTVDANTVGYKTLKYEPVPTPFQVVVDRGQDQKGHEIITGRRVEAGVVYDGAREVAVASLQNVPDTGTVYLTATRAAGAAQWGNFKLDTKPAAPETGEALNVKLYDFAQGKVVMDYRTTFLTLPAGGLSLEGGPDSNIKISQEQVNGVPTGKLFIDVYYV